MNQPILPRPLQQIDTSQANVVDGILYGDDGRVAQYVCQSIGDSVLITQLARAVGILRDGIQNGAANGDLTASLVAGVIWWDHKVNIPGRDPDTDEDFTWSKISCSVACSDLSAATPELIHKILRYPFWQLGVDVITGEISLRNHRAVRQAEKLGFRKVGELSACRAGGDIGLFALRRDQCEIWNAYKPETESVAA